MDANINLQEGSASNEVSSHRLNDQNVDPASVDPASSMEGSFRRIIDLNQQVASRDSLGVLQGGSAKPKETKPRPQTQGKSNAAMRVMIETKQKVAAANRRKRRLKVRKQQNLLRASNPSRESQEGKRNLTNLRIDNTNVSSMLQTGHTVSIRDALSPDMRINRLQLDSADPNKTVSSFYTTGLPHSCIKNARIFSQMKVRPPADSVLNTDSSPPNRESQGSRDHHNVSNLKEQILNKKAPQKPDFIVKTFTNSLESKVQRQARLRGTANPYSQMKHNIIINPFDKRSQNRQGSVGPVGSAEVKSTQRTKRSVEPSIADPQASLMRESNQEPASPLRGRKESFSGGIQRGQQDINNEANQDSQRKQISSLFVSDGPELFENIQVIPREEYGDKIAKLDYQSSTLQGEFRLKESISIKQSEAQSHCLDFVDSRLQTHEEEKPLITLGAIEKKPSGELTQPGQIKLDEILLYENSIMKTRQEIKNKIQNTKIFAEQPPQANVQNTGDLCVYHMSLLPRDGNKRTMTAVPQRDRSYQQMLCNSNLTRSMESVDNGHSSSQTSIRPLLNVKKKQSAVKRNAVQRQIMKKRIEATEKFNKEFNRPISIRRTNAQLIRAAEPEVLCRAVADMRMVQRTLDAAQLSSAESSVRDLNSNEEKPAHAIQAVIKRKSKNTRSLIISAKSSYRTSQRENSTKRDNPETNDRQPTDQVISLTKKSSVKEAQSVTCDHRNHWNIVKKHGQHKSLVYSRKAQPHYLHQHHHFGTQFRRSLPQLRTGKRSRVSSSLRESLTSDPTQQVYSCKDEIQGPAKKSGGSQTEDGYIQEASLEQTNVPDLSDTQNPYNLTLAERQQIKDKNRSLISQFQKSELKRQYFDAPQSQQRPKMQDQSTSPIIEKKRKPSTSIGFNQHIPMLNNKNSEYAPDTEVQNVEKTNENQHTTSFQDQELSVEKEKKKGADSLNSVQNSPTAEVEGAASPITRPVHHGQTVLKGPKDDFETAQLSSSCRTNDPISSYHLQFKERPASSKEASVITVLKNTGQAVDRNSKTRIISKDCTTRISGSRFSLKQDEESSEEKEEQNYEENLHHQTKNSRNEIEYQNTYSHGTMEIPRHRQTDEVNIDQESLQKVYGGQEEQSQQRQASAKNSNRSRRTVTQLSDRQDVVETNVQTSIAQEEDAADYYTQPTMEKFSADEILSMSENQIEQLPFQDVCSAQQVLYHALQELQDQLNQAAALRKTSLLMTERASQRYQQQKGERAQCIKQKIFTTNYEGNFKSKVPDSRVETPFSVEQKQMRKRSALQSRVPTGIQESKSAANYSSHALNAAKPVRVMLVGERQPVDKKRQEIDNYFKFKRKQERNQKKKERFDEQKAILSQCSPEEVLLLGKIKILMDTQNLLVEKAKLSAVEELILPQHTEDLKSSLHEFDQINQESKNSIRKLQIEGLIDQKHLPKGQRVTSRQSLRKLLRTGESHQAQTLIIAAHEKLKLIDRNNARPMSNAKPSTLRKKDLLPGHSDLHLRARSGLSSSTNRKSKIQVQSSEMIFTRQSFLGLNKEMPQIDSQETRHLITEGDQIVVHDNLYCGEPNYKQNLTSTINLYLQKVASDRNATIAGTPDGQSKQPSTKIISMPLSMSRMSNDTTTRQLQIHQNMDPNVMKQGTEVINTGRRAKEDLVAEVTFETQAEKQEDGEAQSSLVSNAADSPNQLQNRKVDLETVSQAFRLTKNKAGPVSQSSGATKKDKRPATSHRPEISRTSKINAAAVSTAKKNFSSRSPSEQEFLPSKGTSSCAYKNADPR